MQIYLAAAPKEAQAAARFRYPLAHAAYRIGPKSSLLRQNLLLQSRGGLLSVSDRDAPPIEDPESLRAAMLRECSRWGYQGVLLDFEERPRGDRQSFARQLGQALAANRRTLYLPERYLEENMNAVALIGTAVSGGSFTDHLREAAKLHGGAGRLALDAERLRMDFRLPSPTGLGEPLTCEALANLMARESPQVFFSQDLCARYFTYVRDGQAHFVLFDDAETMRQKLRTGTALGYSAAFFVWPEIQDIAENLFRAGGQGGPQKS